MKKTTIIFIALVFLASCGGRNKENNYPTLFVFEREWGNTYVFEIRLFDRTHSQVAWRSEKLDRQCEKEDFFLAWNADLFVLHVIPKDSIYRLESRLFGLPPSDPNVFISWDFDWHFKGYSTNENLLEAQVLSFFLKHRDKTPQVIAQIAPTIKEWTNFYSIDLAQMELVQIEAMLTAPPICFRVETIGSGIYSPNKRFSANYKAEYFLRNREYISLVSALLLFDSESKNYYWFLELWHEAGLEAAFWLSDNVLVVVGQGYFNSALHHHIWIFDIANQIRINYRIPIRIENENFGTYRGKGFLKRGRIFHN